MDYTKWPYPQPPNPNPYYSSLHYPYYSSQSQNPYPKPPEFSAEPAVGPPGVDSYASLSSYPQGHAAYDAHGFVSYDPHPQQTVDAASYYSDPNAHNWALKEAVRQFGVDPAAYAGADMAAASNGMTEFPIPSSTLWANPKAQSHGNGKKKQPKKTKILQSAYCEVCKIDCNSKDVLDQHKLGKKHQKNLERLTAATAGSSYPVIGPQENPYKGKPVNGKKSRKKAAQPVENLETKRRKVLEGGAAAEAVRTCTVCNVVCNSETVFNYHLAGQKHAAMVKKHAAAAGVAPTI